MNDSRFPPKSTVAPPALTDDGELGAIVAVVQQAATLVMSHFRTRLEVELKGPADPVTRADREANELICSALSARFPDAGIVAEESVPQQESMLAELVARSRVLFVDPLDGTREFVAEVPEFAVMVGLVEAGLPVLGVVALPAEGIVLAARVGVGVWLLDETADGPTGPLRPLLDRATGPDRQRLRVVVSRSQTPELSARTRAALGPHQLHRCGSVGVKVARLVTGAADLYLHRGRGLKLWDCCGPEAIVRAAGGRMTDCQGHAVRYATAALGVADGVVAGAAGVHEQAMLGLGIDQN